ncbi:MAG TPA: hypothetical protein VK750_04070 [Cytophagaceae bacterium]|jgi:hypothetical protein|nr:hypothetical protein [Cytophagaceae bacterium]
MIHVIVSFRLYIVLSLTFVLLTFCKSPYKTSSATFPRKDSKNTVQQDRKELKKHLEKQERKVQEVDELENKYRPPAKRKQRGEVPPQETFY